MKPNKRDEEICINAVQYLLEQVEFPVQGIENIALALWLADACHKFFFDREILNTVPFKKADCFKSIEYIKSLKRLLNKNKAIFEKLNEGTYRLAKKDLSIKKQQSEYDGLSPSDMLVIRKVVSMLSLHKLFSIFN